MRELISLGKRCDSAFQLRSHSGSNVAHFFDWLVTPINAVVRAFERNFDIFRPEYLSLRHEGGHRYVFDDVNHFSFHHQFPMIGADVSTDFILHYPSMKSKFDYLADRFRSYATSRPVTFVRRDVSFDEANRLERAYFDRFPASDAEFLYIVHGGAGFSTKNGHAVIMDPPRTGLGDLTQWAELLNREGLITQGFCLGSEEILGNDDGSHGLAGTERFNEGDLMRAIATNPNSLAFRIELSRYYQRRYKWEDAYAAIEPVLHLYNSPEISVEKAHISSYLGGCDAGYDGARIEIEEVLQLSNQAVEKHLDLLIKQGDLELAADICDKRLARNPVLPGLYFRRANCKLQLKDPLEARMSIDAALRLSPSRCVYHQLKATISLRLGHFAEAILSQVAALECGGGANCGLGLDNLLARLIERPDRDAVFCRLMDLNRANNNPRFTELIRARMAQLSPETTH